MPGQYLRSRDCDAYERNALAHAHIRQLPKSGRIGTSAGTPAEFDPRTLPPFPGSIRVHAGTSERQCVVLYPPIYMDVHARWQNDSSNQRPFAASHPRSAVSLMDPNLIQVERQVAMPRTSIVSGETSRARIVLSFLRVWGPAAHELTADLCPAIIWSSRSQAPSAPQLGEFCFATCTPLFLSEEENPSTTRNRHTYMGPWKPVNTNMEAGTDRQLNANRRC